MARGVENIKGFRALSLFFVGMGRWGQRDLRDPLSRGPTPKGGTEHFPLIYHWYAESLPCNSEVLSQCIHQRKLWQCGLISCCDAHAVIKCHETHIECIKHQTHSCVLNSNKWRTLLEEDLAEMNMVGQRGCCRRHESPHPHACMVFACVYRIFFSVLNWCFVSLCYQRRYWLSDTSRYRR